MRGRENFARHERRNSNRVELERGGKMEKHLENPMNYEE